MAIALTLITLAFGPVVGRNPHSLHDRARGPSIGTDGSNPALSSAGSLLRTSPRVATAETRRARKSFGHVVVRNLTSSHAGCEPSSPSQRNWKFESIPLHRRVRKLSVPLRHDAPFDCGSRALAMFYHTVVVESGDVVIALEADSNRSPLEKGHAIRRADRDGLLSGCPANSKMTVGPLVRIRFIESADRGGHQRSARADDRQFNRVAGPRGRCDSSLRAFARSSAVRSGLSPVSQDAKRTSSAAIRAMPGDGATSRRLGAAERLVCKSFRGRSP